MRESANNVHPDILKLRQRRQQRKAIRMRKFIIRTILTVCVVLFATVFAASKLSKTHAEEQGAIKYYTSIMIHSGDTLDSIAEQYVDNVHYESKAAYIEEVVSMNHLDNPDELYAGNYIIVPYFAAEVL